MRFASALWNEKTNHFHSVAEFEQEELLLHRMHQVFYHLPVFTNMFLRTSQHKLHLLVIQIRNHSAKLWTTSVNSSRLTQLTRVPWSVELTLAMIAFHEACKCLVLFQFNPGRCVSGKCWWQVFYSLKTDTCTIFRNPRSSSFNAGAKNLQSREHRWE